MFHKFKGFGEFRAKDGSFAFRFPTHNSVLKSMLQMSSLTRGEVVPFVYPPAFCLSGIRKSLIHIETQWDKVIWWDRPSKFCDVISSETNFLYILKSPPKQCRFKNVVFDITIFGLSVNFQKIIHHAAWPSRHMCLHLSCEIFIYNYFTFL